MEPTPAAKPESAFRDYAAARPGVREFYRLNHAHQTVDFVRAKRDEYLPLRRRRMGVWQAFDALAELVDESDPDLELGQRDLDQAHTRRRQCLQRALEGLADRGIEVAQHVALRHGEAQAGELGRRGHRGCLAGEDRIDERAAFNRACQRAN